MITFRLLFVVVFVGSPPPPFHPLLEISIYSLGQRPRACQISCFFFLRPLFRSSLDNCPPRRTLGLTGPALTPREPHVGPPSMVPERLLPTPNAHFLEKKASHLGARHFMLSGPRQGVSRNPSGPILCNCQERLGAFFNVSVKQSFTYTTGSF